MKQEQKSLQNTDKSNISFFTVLILSLAVVLAVAVTLVVLLKTTQRPISEKKEVFIEYNISDEVGAKETI